MPTPPRRKWFQFGLGTLFLLMTLLAVFLASESHTIRERTAALKALTDRNGGSWTIDAIQRDPNWSLDQAVQDRCRIPVWRRWLGDEAIAVIIDTQGSDEDRSALRDAFPEAVVMDRLQL